MRKEEAVITQQIAGAITGYFTTVSVPTEVVVGQDIKVTIGFYALNPGALYWKTFLVMDSFLLGRKVLATTREVGQEGGREATFTLGKMPDAGVSVSFFLFAHDDANYQWNWDEYNVWYDGGLVNITYLDSEYKFISPVTPPPAAELSGVITEVKPLAFPFGDPIDLLISFKAYVETLWEQTFGWDTRVTATLNGLKDSDIQYHIGRDGSRTNQSLQLGAMPNKTLTGKVILEGRGKNWLRQPTEWVLLNTKLITVTVGVVTPPPGGAELSGVITSVTPASIKYGSPLDMYVSFKAYADTVWEQVKGWDTRVTMTLDSLNDSDIQYHIGRDGSRTNQALHLGTMPNRTLTGKVTLEGRGKDLLGMPTAWIPLDSKAVTVTLPGVTPPPVVCKIDADCPVGYVCVNGKCVPEEKEFPWLPVALVGAGAIVAAVAIATKKPMTKKA